MVLCVPKRNFQEATGLYDTPWSVKINYHTLFQKVNFTKTTNYLLTWHCNKAIVFRNFPPYSLSWNSCRHASQSYRWLRGPALPSNRSGICPTGASSRSTRSDPVNVAASATTTFSACYPPVPWFSIRTSSGPNSSRDYSYDTPWLRFHKIRGIRILSSTKNIRHICFRLSSHCRFCWHKNKTRTSM